MQKISKIVLTNFVEIIGEITHSVDSLGDLYSVKRPAKIETSLDRDEHGFFNPRQLRLVPLLRNYDVPKDDVVTFKGIHVLFPMDIDDEIQKLYNASFNPSMLILPPSAGEIQLS